MVPSILITVVACYFVFLLTNHWVGTSFPRLFLRISRLERRPWWLFSPLFSRAAKSLEAIGYVEVGWQVTRTGVLELPSRLFYSETDATYASVWSFLFLPHVTFVSALSDGLILQTGSAATWRGRADLQIVRSKGPLATRARVHAVELAGLCERGRHPTSATVGAALATFIELERRSSVIRFWPERIRSSKDLADAMPSSLDVRFDLHETHGECQGSCHPESKKRLSQNRCLFCSKASHEVGELIVGGEGAICAGCVGVCREILNGADPD